MSEFVIRATGEVLSPLELQARYPNTSNPQALPEVAEVEAVDPPQFDGVVERDGVEKVRGVWRQKWTTRPYTAEELQSQHDTRRAQLVTLATSMRWERETGGVTLPNGIRVATSKADQDRITSVLVNAAEAGVESVDFKAESGWATLTIDQVRGIASAVARHVQACFSAERRHHEAIAVLADANLASYDITTGWPV
jgi:hypothetical protein